MSAEKFVILQLQTIEDDLLNLKNEKVMIKESTFVRKMSRQDKIYCNSLLSMTKIIKQVIEKLEDIEKGNKI